MKEKIRIGITHGDFNGINYEVIIKTFTDATVNEFFTPIIYGSSKAAAYYRKTLNMDNFSFNLIADLSEANVKKTNIINAGDINVKVEIGALSTLAGATSIKALDMAIDDIQSGKIDAIVTCPINTNALDSDNNFQNHSGYLADKFGVEDCSLLMINELMRVGFVTEYIPLSEVPKAINSELILKKISLINDSLKNDFLIRAPRIAVLSLNPYSRDRRASGHEDSEIIIPAIEQAKLNGILAFGTYSANEFFALGEFVEFDAILAMYYDQGMIPFKSIGLSGGVSYTAGLPIVQTAPEHGTRYNIAGKGIASADSLRDALFLAAEIYGNRKFQIESEVNPLKIRTNHPKKALE
jgi:4-hydroxythreonine-4-phosphate dehydrogenase